MSIAISATLAGLSITEAYESDEGLTHLLRRANIAANERTRINNEGFNNLKSLIDNFATTKAFEDTIKDLNKTFGALLATNRNRVYFNIRAVKNLTAIHYYTSRCLALNKIPDIRILDIPQAVIYMENRYINYANSKEDVKVDKIKVPEFTGDNWILFRDKFVVQLRNISGSRDIPLEYVIRQDPGDENLVESESPDLDELDPIQNARLAGNFFKEDNAHVYRLLQGFLVGTPGHNYIHSHAKQKQGRKAWLSLRAHYEGDSFKDTYRERAFSQLQKTFYHGERARFNFEKYIHTHREAHRWLEEIGHNSGIGLDTSSKIQYFKAGIKANAGLETDLSVIRSRPELKDNFDKFVNYLSESVATRSSRLSNLDASVDRKVSGLHNSNFNGGRGRGRGRGRGNGRGGRGRGRGYGRGGSSSNNNGSKNESFRMVDGKKIENKKYPFNEYQKLNGAQRKALYEMKKGTNDNNDDNASVSNTTIASLNTTLQRVEKAMVAGISHASDDNEDTTSHQRTFDDTQASAGSIGAQFMKRRRKD